MNKETLEALKGSIEKWRKIRFEGEIDQGSDNCPLCQLLRFNDDGMNPESCRKCPVYQKTKRPFCEGSPYDTWCDLCDVDELSQANTPPKKRQATLEIKFLKSLLPKGEEVI